MRKMLVALCAIAAQGARAVRGGAPYDRDAAPFISACAEHAGFSDLLYLLTGDGHACDFTNVQDAITAAAPGTAVLALATSGGEPTPLKQSDLDAARTKGMRVVAELAGAELAGTATTERVVVTNESALASTLGALRILSAHAVNYTDLAPLMTSDATTHLSLATVAGYDDALYGLPGSARPFLVEDDGILLVAGRLGGVVSDRWGPARDGWDAVVAFAAAFLNATVASWGPSVRPRYARNDTLPGDAEASARTAGVAWLRSMIPGPSTPTAFGRMGIYEGFTSEVGRGGRQALASDLRDDCIARGPRGMASSSTTRGARR